MMKFFVRQTVTEFDKNITSFCSRLRLSFGNEFF